MEVRIIGTIGYTFTSSDRTGYRYCYQDKDGTSFVSSSIYATPNDAEIALYRRSER